MAGARSPLAGSVRHPIACASWSEGNQMRDVVLSRHGNDRGNDFHAHL